MIRDIRSFLKQEEGAGRLADVTARLGGDTLEIDPQGWIEDGALMGRRLPGESKTATTKRGVKHTAPPYQP